MSAKVTKWLLLKNAQESKFRKLKWCITKKGHQLDLLTEILNRLCGFFSINSEEANSSSIVYIGILMF